MAKLSAGGAQVLARWENDRGVQYALRSDGVMLRKIQKGDGWTRLFRIKPVDQNLIQRGQNRLGADVRRVFGGRS